MNATNSDGLAAANNQPAKTNTQNANDLDFPTCKRPRKDESNLISRLALAGHTVHLLKDGTYLVCKWGYTHHASDIDSLKAFAVRLGVCHE